MNQESLNDSDNEFIDMLQTYKGIVYKIAKSYTYNTADHQDLIQEITLQLWKSYGQYNAQFRLTTWIYKISLNVAISFYRKITIRSKYNAPLEEDVIDPSFDASANKQDEIDHLMKLIHQLDKINRAIIILYLDGVSHTDIAHILDISTSNVGTKIQRIKSSLEQQMKEECNHG